MISYCRGSKLEEKVIKTKWNEIETPCSFVCQHWQWLTAVTVFSSWQLMSITNFCFCLLFFCLFLRTSSTGGGGGGGGGNVTNTMTNAFFIVFQFFGICICRRHLSQQCCHHQWRPSRSRKRKKVLTLSPLFFWLMFIVITAPFNFSIFETNTHT